MLSMHQIEDHLSRIDRSLVARVKLDRIPEHVIRQWMRKDYRCETDRDARVGKEEVESDDHKSRDETKITEHIRAKRFKSSETPKSIRKSDRKNQPKDSSNRFSDQLLQLILSYLSFEDKFRFECLSKRTQRLIFQKQKELTIYCSDRSAALLTAVIKGESRLYYRIDRRVLTKVLTKMSRLETIRLIHDLRGFASKILVDSEDIELIADLCPHLKSLSSNHNYIDMSSVSPQSVSYLADKRGLGVQCLQVCDRSKALLQMLAKAPNLTCLDVDHLSTIASSLPMLPTLAQLSHFSVQWRRTKSSAQVMSGFKELRLGSVRELTFSLSMKGCDISEITTFFECFPNLRSLNLCVTDVDKRQVRCAEEGLRDMLTVFPNLDRLAIRFRVPMTNSLSCVAEMRDLRSVDNR